MAVDIKTSPPAALATLAFSMLLALPILLTPWVDHEARAKWEKRPLVSLKDLKVQLGQSSFFETLESVIDDHVFPALEVNRSYRQFQFYALQDAPVPNVALGDDGLVFLTSHDRTQSVSSLEKFCRPVPSRANQLHEQLNALSAKLSLRNVSLILAVVPSKLALYADRLPPSVSRSLRADCLKTIGSGALAAQRLSVLAQSYTVVYPFDTMFDLRDTPHFYPSANFHADSRINHEFALAYLRQANISTAIPGVEDSLEDIAADLPVLGFTRSTTAWRYNYSQGVNRSRRIPAWFRDVYPGIRGAGEYNTERPLSNLNALVLSNSFGVYLAPHLAPGYQKLVQTNIKHLRESEVTRFLDVALEKSGADHLVLLYHDEGLNSSSLAAIATY